MKKEYIFWPDAYERKLLVCSSYDELPYCIGYMDGTEIKLHEAPVCDRDSYYSRKKIFSIKAQVSTFYRQNEVCLYKYTITDYM